MPVNEWSKLYVLRDGRPELFFSLCHAAETVSAWGNHLFEKNKDETQFWYRKGEHRYSIASWGDLIGALDDLGYDLTGVMLTPKQRQYDFVNQLKGRNLSNAKLNSSVLDDLDLTGTNFNAALLNEASLRRTTGAKPVFVNAQAYKINLTDAHYTEPDFRSMKAARSVHLRSTYEMPMLNKADWNSSHLVGTRMFLTNDKGTQTLDLNGAVAAACLFYGQGGEKSEIYFRFAQAAFPGSCFYNLNIYAGSDTAQKADFSSLNRDDPRLTSEEKEFVANLGQWLSNDIGMDGLKVSPDLELTLDTKKLYTLFSEIEITEDSVDDKTLFFSKGSVLNRTSFHECTLGDITPLLPESLAGKVRATDASVIVARVESAIPIIIDSSTLTVPEIAFDPDQIALQVTAMETAGLANAMELGNSLQGTFAQAATLVSEWVMNKLGQKSLLTGKVDSLSSAINVYTLDAIINPEMPLLAAPVKKGFWKSLLDDTPAPLAKPEDPFFAIARDIKALPEHIATAQKDSSAALADAEKLKKFLGTLKSAVETYVAELDRQNDEIVRKNPDVLSILNIRRQSLDRSRALMTGLYDGVAEIITNMVKDGGSIDWVQGITVPQLNTAFTQAAGTHQLAVSLHADPLQWKKDPKLTGLYNAIIVEGAADVAKIQAKEAFEASRRRMVDVVAGVCNTLKTIQSEKTLALKKLLVPT